MTTHNGFQTLFEHASMSIIVINAGGKIVLANRFSLVQFGYTISEMMGMNIEQLLPLRFHKQHTFSRSLFFQKPQNRPMGTGRDLFAINKQGHEFPVEISLAHYTNNGEAFVAAYITDITERKKAELELKSVNSKLEAKIAHHTRSLKQTVTKLRKQIKHVEMQDRKLQKMNAFLSSIWHNAGAIIIATDTNGTIELFNPAAEKYLGYTADELTGRQTPMLFHDLNEVKYYASLFSAQLHTPVEPGFETFVAKARRNLHNQHEWTYIHKNGHRFPVDVSITALRNKEKKIIGFLGIAFDISDQKMAEVELRTALQKQKEVNELKSRFVSIASHEFRTPLSTIISSAYLVSQYKKTEDQEKRRSHIDRIVSSASMLTDILDDFLSIGKIEEGKIQVRSKTFNIKDHINQIIEDLQSLTKQGQHIHYQHKGAVQVYTDPSLLKHIVFNMLSNAIKFSPDETTINIKTCIEENSLQLSVKDKGIGIPEVDQPHLFDLFYRASNAEYIEGTGLGLHIMKRYTELLGGEIDFKSKPDRGSEFRILINKAVSHEKDFAY